MTGKNDQMPTAEPSGMGRQAGLGCLTAVAVFALVAAGGFILGLLSIPLWAVGYELTVEDEWDAALDDLEPTPRERRRRGRQDRALDKHRASCLKTHAATGERAMDADLSARGQDPREVEQACRDRGGTCDAESFISRAAAACILDSANGVLTTMTLALNEGSSREEACSVDKGSLELGYEPRYGRTGAPRWRWTPSVASNDTESCTGIVFVDLDAETGASLAHMTTESLSRFEAERRAHNATAVALAACRETYPVDGAPNGVEKRLSEVEKSCEAAGLSCSRDTLLTRAAAECMVDVLVGMSDEGCTSHSEWSYDLKVEREPSGAGAPVWQATRKAGRCSLGMVKLDAQTGAVLHSRRNR
ncbi:MAG: hypothetical protein ACON4N_16415 [Myxococcota bacterium]